jgi:type VI secretion system protein ImpK
MCLGVIYGGFAWVLGEQRESVLQSYRSLDMDAGDSTFSGMR